jgi:hypothetical protein
MVALFFILEWDRNGFDKKHAGRHYAELLFLHPAGSMSHVVHFSVSGLRNVDALLFMLGWARCALHEKRDGTQYAEPTFLHPVGSAGHVVHSGASRLRNVEALFSSSGGPSAISNESVLEHFTLN